MGLPVYAETCPQYFHLTWDDLVNAPDCELSGISAHSLIIETLPLTYMLREQQDDLLATPSTDHFRSRGSICVGRPLH